MFSKLGMKHTVHKSGSDGIDFLPSAGIPLYYDDTERQKQKHRNYKTFNNLKPESFISEYTDFKTIDWVRDRHRSYLRRMYHEKIYSESSWLQKIKIIIQSYSLWMLMVGIGVFGAITAVVVSFGAQYFIDLREGICPHNLLYNREGCCWNVLTNGNTHDSCKHWKTWGQVFNFERDSTGHFVTNYMCYIIISVLLASCSAFLVKELAPYASGGSIPEIKTILSGFIMRGYLGFSTYIIKTSALILSVASGLMLGQEGPMVHISCCITNMLIRFFPKYRENEYDKREILSSGCAAGVAIAFGAPISGVLFSLEETSFYFTGHSLVTSLSASLIGAFTLSFLVPYSSGNIILYEVFYGNWSVYELPFFAIIGLYGGFSSFVITKCVLFWNKLKKSSIISKYPILEVVVVAFITAVTCFPMHVSRISNHHLIRNLFSNCIYREVNNTTLCELMVDKFHSLDPYVPVEAILSYITSHIKKLTITLLIKSVLLIITFGIKVPVGIFVPSIALGALFGRIIGLCVELLSIKYPTSQMFKTTCTKSNQRCIYPSVYAVLGSAAVLGGFTQMTICAVVIIIEITGELEYIPPLIFVVMIAKWAANALLKLGIYEELLIINNYPYMSNKDEISVSFTVRDALNGRRKQPLKTIPIEGISLKALVELLNTTPFTGYPVVSASDHLQGYVYHCDILAALKGKINENTKESGLDHHSIKVSFSQNNLLTTTTSDSGDDLNGTYINLRHLMDPSPICVDIDSSFNLVIYFFQKLGVRQILITLRGRLHTIITRKDAIMHLRHCSHSH